LDAAFSSYLTVLKRKKGETSVTSVYSAKSTWYTNYRSELVRPWFVRCSDDDVKEEFNTHLSDAEKAASAAKDN
jgi:hypothetical protein